MSQRSFFFDFLGIFSFFLAQRPKGASGIYGCACLHALATEGRFRYIYIYMYSHPHPTPEGGGEKAKSQPPIKKRLFVFFSCGRQARRSKSKKPAAKNKKAFCLLLLWEAMQTDPRKTNRRQTDRPPRALAEFCLWLFFCLGKKGPQKKKPKAEPASPAGEQTTNRKTL